jgi:CheY-like chemotaxis protein
MARILSVGPDHDRLAVRNGELRSYGHQVRSAETRADALDLARSGVFEIILICDQFLPAYAAQLADEFHNATPGTAILVLAGRSSRLSASEIHAWIARQVPSSVAA